MLYQCSTKIHIYFATYNHLLFKDVRQLWFQCKVVLFLFCSFIRNSISYHKLFDGILHGSMTYIADIREQNLWKRITFILYLASVDWPKTIARQDEKHSNFGATYIRLDGTCGTSQEICTPFCALYRLVISIFSVVLSDMFAHIRQCLTGFGSNALLFTYFLMFIRV